MIRDRFEALLQKGYDILHVAFSSALSGSYNNVCVTARDLMDDYPDSRIVVIDSLNVSLSEAIMVMQGDLYREAGHTLEETAAFLEEFKTHMNVQFTVDDLFHLQRGGPRIQNHCSGRVRSEFKAFSVCECGRKAHFRRHRERAKEEPAQTG